MNRKDRNENLAIINPEATLTPEPKGKNKPDNLRVTIPEVSKSFYLTRTGPDKDWDIRFTPPPWMRLELGLKVARIHRSTGHRAIPAARAQAREILRSFWSDDAGRQAEALRLRAAIAIAAPAPLAAVAEAYRKGARSICDKEEMKQQTINGNIGQLRKLTGSPDLAKSAACLTSDLVECFKQSEIARVDPGDPAAMLSKKLSVNSTLTQARSIFAADFMPLYAHLGLPDLAPFRAVKRFKVDKSATRYEPIAQPMIDRMEAEIRALRAERPALYLAFYLMLWCGLRQSEVREARREWIEYWPEGARLAVKRRAYFKPKGIAGEVGLAPTLLADIGELSGATEPLDYLIPAATPTERRNLLRYDLSRLVRAHLGMERTKTCHELRKHAISMVLMRSGNYVDTLKFSRHADVQTLQNHYGSHLGTVAAITSSNWRAA